MSSMFVNVAPKEFCINQTLNSLRFALKGNKCHLDTAVENYLWVPYMVLTLMYWIQLAIDKT